MTDREELQRLLAENIERRSPRKIVAIAEQVPSLLAELAEKDAEIERLAAVEKLAAPQWRGHNGFLHLPDDDSPVACYVQGYNACIDDLRRALGQSATSGELSS